MVIFTKKFGTLDPHLAILWVGGDPKSQTFYGPQFGTKSQKKRFFFTPSLIALNENTLYKLNTRIGLASKPRFLSKGRASQFRQEMCVRDIKHVLLFWSWGGWENFQFCTRSGQIGQNPNFSSFDPTWLALQERVIGLPT